MWKIKKFKTIGARKAWLDKVHSIIQWKEIFVENAWAVEYRFLKCNDILDYP
jgi:hypothetical protein